VVTTQKYITYLETAFIFFTLQPFSLKIKQQLTAQKKIYCFDQGFLSQKMMRLTTQNGKLYENIIAIALKIREYTTGEKIFYWTNPQQEEVDFVIYKHDHIENLIQVSILQDLEKTKEREIRGLLKAKYELNCDNLIVITESKEAVEEVEWYGMKGKIQYIPAWKWLLELS